MNEKTSLIKVEGGNRSAIDEALGNAITLWAEVSTDAECLRYRDLIRVKDKAIGAFFRPVRKIADDDQSARCQAQVNGIEASGYIQRFEARLTEIGKECLVGDRCEGLAATIYAALSPLSIIFTWLISGLMIGRSIFIELVRLA